ncbi:MAG: molybdopterin cofactor-binding domain-containing protein [Acidimicrobiales bacterium]
MTSAVTDAPASGPAGLDVPAGDAAAGRSPGAALVTFTLNGAEVGAGADLPNLLYALREELGVTSPKDGCSPSGQCGCCTVLLDDKAVVACQVGMARVAGKHVTTLEGMEPAELDRYVDAFASVGALQCGFCTPGILMRLKPLIDKKGASLTREDAARHLGGNLCRCTGYVKILDAVEVLAAGHGGGEGRAGDASDAYPGSQGGPVADQARGGRGGIGHRTRRYQAAELATGSRGYVDDIRLPGMLHAALRLADHARARVSSIDVSAALEVPGVEAVLTAADVPGELRVGIIERDWPVLIPVGGLTSYLGDVLAVAVASDRLSARAAAGLVRVDYEVLEPFTDAMAAMDSPVDAVWGLQGNVLSRSSYTRGDVDTALARSAHVVRQVFQTQRVEHAFLEPESTVAAPTAGGGLHVWSGGQGIWDDRDQIASVLGVEASRVTVELVSNGGAFGGKEDMSNQAQTALAAYLLKRPVKCTLSREESFLMHPKRHPVRLSYEAGCDAEGRLTALRARIVGDSGPYASVGMKVLERAAGHAGGPYRVPAIDVESVAVRTNNPVCGAFRGFGANQAQFAMEGTIDRLAAAAGLPGYEMRRRNVVEPGSVWGPGQVLDGGALGARKCLDAIAEEYEEAKRAGYAVGVGLGIKNSGLGNGFEEVARASVTLDGCGGAMVRHCWTEMGQGVNTVALQVAASELAIEPDAIRVVVDTTREMGAGQTTGSRGTLMAAGSIRDACNRAKADGLRPGVEYSGEYRVDWTNSIEEGLEHPVVHSTLAYAAQLVVVDRPTGKVVKVVAAHDVGRVVNPTLCEGQVQGAVHMGLGYAMSEEFPTDASGRPLNTTLRSLGIIRAKDVPEIEVLLIECPQPGSPYGIKGVGEIGLVPTAGAVAAAFFDADGTWRDSLPMTPPLPTTAPIAMTPPAPAASGREVA